MSTASVVSFTIKTVTLPDGSRYVKATEADTHPTLLRHKESGTGHFVTGLRLPDGRLRRPTPRERERLQGYGDGWTAELNKQERLAATGDGVPVPVFHWLAQQFSTIGDNAC